MSSTQPAFLPTQSASARYAESAHTRANRGSPSPTRRNTSTAPSQSVGAAGRTASPQISPSVSTSRCRLRPATFFPPVVPLRAARLGRLHGLAIGHAGARRLLPVEELADVPPEGVVELLPDALVAPGVEVVRHRLPRGEVVRQHPPGGPGAGQVEDRVDDVLAVVGPGPAGPPRGPLAAREQVGDVGPLEVGQVTRVSLPCGGHPDRVIEHPGGPEVLFLDGLSGGAPGAEQPPMLGNVRPGKIVSGAGCPQMSGNVRLEKKLAARIGR